jgi:D-glycerate 3-kinase
MPDNDVNRDKQWCAEFCQHHSLPAHYQTMAEDYFLPLAAELARSTKSPLLVGINGCQGSGKSTLATLLTQRLSEHYGKRVAQLSIDDFYLSRAARQQLAANTHPLFITRGVPGTHDIALLQQTLVKLRQGHTGIAIPRFNKATDDRRPISEWDVIDGPVDIILLEGWCVGVNPQIPSDLLTPINALEAQEDQDGRWRSTINRLIARDYVPLFALLDTQLMLKAPSFDCVYRWRQQQEEKLHLAHISNAQKTKARIMNATQLQRFVQHYQRLTEHMLRDLPDKVDSVFRLNEQHRITGRYKYGT